MAERQIALRSDRSWTGVALEPANERGAVTVRLDGVEGTAVLPVDSLVYLDEDVVSKAWPPDSLETKTQP